MADRPADPHNPAPQGSPHSRGAPAPAAAYPAGDDARERRDDVPAPVAPSAQVREDDLEPHDGLRYIAKLFKALSLLLIFMLIAEMIIGLQQDGMAALGPLLIEATRLIVFAGFLWGIGDMAVLLIESNHDLRASRILLGRLNGRMERFLGDDTQAGAPGRPAPSIRPGPPQGL